MQNSMQLNEYVRDILSPFLQGRYQLTQEGQDKVIHANASLDAEYAHAHNLPVADWCFHDIREKLNHMAPLCFGALLDVCAGTGYISLNVMRKGLFKKCVALDINSEALDLLRDRANKMGIQGIEVQCGDIMKTHFADSTFDCVMGNAFLHHLPDNRTFLSEAYRILNDGGVLCLTSEPSISAIKWQNYFPRMLMGLLGKKHRPKGEVPLTDIWQFAEADLRGLLQEVGFKEILVLGGGRWTVAFGTLIDRIWVRLTGHSAPGWVGFVFYSMQVLRRKILPVEQPDRTAILGVLARK